MQYHDRPDNYDELVAYYDMLYIGGAPKEKENK
jgi:hypothetical protein